MHARFAAFALALFALGCGGAGEIEDGEPDNTELEATAGGEAIDAHDREGGVAIEGLMGTISQLAVQRGIDPKMGSFLRCFTTRYDEVELLGGHIEFAFRIRRDGTVLWVYPRASTVGDRETELCLLREARSIRFDRPQGGEAEFGYPLDLETPDDVRPPVSWPASHVESTIDANRSSVSSCGRGFMVTAYVARGGGITAVGAATPDQENAENLDCVVDAVRQWTMPDPGSYPAKVSFSL